MVLFAQALVVVSIPEQLMVALVRLDVIDDFRRTNPAFAFAMNTEGMFFPECPGVLGPFVIVATLAGCAPLLIMFLAPLFRGLRTRRSMYGRFEWHDEQGG